MQELPKVLHNNLIKQHLKIQSQIPKSLNISVSETGSIVCTWKVLTQGQLKLTMKKVSEKKAIIRKELQDELKAAGALNAENIKQ